MQNRHLNRQKLYNKLQLIDTASLSQQDQINWSVLSYKLKNELDSYTNKEHCMSLTAESGFHVGISWISKRVQFRDEQDYLARMMAIPEYLQQQMFWMEKGIENGITQPAVILIGYEESIKAYIKDDVTQSTFYQPSPNFQSTYQ